MHETLGDTLQRLNKILAKALRRLGEQGAKDEACELAAEAWTVLREVDAREAERMNGLLHQLTCAYARPSADAPVAAGSAVPDAAPQDPILDVRHLPPAQRHELIFERYRQLMPGKGFILVNDHDPKPLYYQLAFEHPAAFTWAPLESGPDVWRVRIGKP